MAQLIFFVLFFIALLVGIFVRFPSLRPFPNTVQYISDKSGYTSADQRIDKKVRQINSTVSEGLNQTRRQMEDRAQRQNKPLDMLENQQKSKDLLKGDKYQKDQDQQRINDQQAMDQTQQKIYQQEQQMIYQQQSQDELQQIRDQQEQPNR